MVDSARVVSLDKLGLNLAAKRGVDAYKLRLPFASPASTPAEVEARMRSFLAAAALHAK
jgi:hypothetical protein